jgi:hypothetical protein
MSRDRNGSNNLDRDGKPAKQNATSHNARSHSKIKTGGASFLKNSPIAMTPCRLIRAFF